MGCLIGKSALASLSVGDAESWFAALWRGDDRFGFGTGVASTTTFESTIESESEYGKIVAN